MANPNHDRLGRFASAAGGVVIGSGVARFKAVKAAIKAAYAWETGDSKSRRYVGYALMAAGAASYAARAIDNSGFGTKIKAKAEARRETKDFNKRQAQGFKTKNLDPVNRKFNGLMAKAMDRSVGLTERQAFHRKASDLRMSRALPPPRRS